MSQINVTTIRNRTGGPPSLDQGVVVGSAATFSSTVSIAGVLTYEDVTNIDSVGIITARTGLKVTAGGIDVTAGGINVTAGIVTATTFSGNLPTTDLTGTITNAQLTAGSVDIAHLAAGTDGKIITWDANGAAAVVGPGADGQVLTSTGAGSPPAFEDAAGGVTLTGSTNNTIATITGADALQGEANLTFDGSTLGVTGAAEFSGLLTLDDTGANAGIQLGTGADFTVKRVAPAVRFNAGADLDHYEFCIGGTEKISFNADGGLTCAGPATFAGEVTLTDDLQVANAIWHHGDDDTKIFFPAANTFSVTTSGTQRMRVDSTGEVTFGASTWDYNSQGIGLGSGGWFYAVRTGGQSGTFGRNTNDGTIVDFRQDGTVEGSIYVSGTTVSYNGAHLSRWSQLAGGATRTEILRGSVLSNLDEMCEWDYPAQDAVLYTDEDELPEGVSVGDVKTPAKDAGTEDNEQLNRMKVSDVEGDKNVSGVFQSWDDDDDTYINDFYCAMTGDFVIRIAQGTTVARGDLLMSAGDGTAKPQDDDIVRSKTIAKVTSTNVSETYADNSYCVPCVLMAC